MTSPAFLAAIVLVLPAVWFARRQAIRRFAWRNLTARPAEAVLVTLGTMLGTAIIVASFVVGDTIKDGVGSIVDTTLGPIDETVVVENPEDLDSVVAAIDGASIDSIDGLATVLSLPTAVTTVGDEPRGEPRVWIAETDFEQARTFGGDEATSGFVDAGPTPVSGEAVITTRFADKLGVSAGDRLVIHAFGSSTTVMVRAVIDRSSAAGYNSVYVAPGTIDSLSTNRPPEAPQPRAEVLVSNNGGFESGADLTNEVVLSLEAAVTGFDGVRIETVKNDVLEDAAADGTEFTTLFNSIGSFAVIAGILLIVNLFVMLGEERRVSLGIMRAIGYARSQVTKVFVLEGAMYSLLASLLGVAAGLGTGWVLVRILKTIFFEQNDFLDIGFAPQFDSMVLAWAIGLGISMVTIWITSIRVSQLNIISAVRDQPQPRTRRGRLKVILSAGFGVIAGAGVAYLGQAQEVQAAVMAGVPIVAFSTIPLLSGLLGKRVSAVVGALAAMIWGMIVFSLFPTLMQEADIDVFVVQGVVLVAGAVTISASADRLWSRAVSAISRLGGGLSSRLGLVYPLARKGRTGLLLGMFSLVVFTITFMAVFSQILGEQTRSLVDDARAGYEIVASSSTFNPVEESEIAETEGVDRVAPLVSSPAEFTVNGQDEPESWKVTGFDARLIETETPKLASRSPEYTSDREAFEAVLADDSLIIIDDFFLDNGSGPGAERYAVGQVVDLVDHNGETRALTIAGVLANDWIFAGSYMGVEAVERYLDPRGTAFYIGVDEGTDPEFVATRLNADLISFGFQATTFEADVAAEVAETLGIFRLFQGFLSIGLVIGIAGLSVVLVRAVRERRRAIGVLRALGAESTTVRGAFLVESAFVAIQGVVIGAVLGLITAYQVIVNSNTFGDGELDFAWPWLGLAIVILVPTIAALLAAAIPARRASQIAPAVALRAE